MNKKMFLIPLLVSMMALSGCVNDKKKINVTGVELDKETLNLTVGDSSTLVASILPEDATDKTITWSTSADSVATIDNGVVTAKAAGTSTITVKTNDGGFTDTCLITVEEVKTEIDVKFSVVSSYVTASVDKKTAKEGEDITITIKSVTDGYDLKAISLKDSEGKTISFIADPTTSNKYTYKQPKDGVCKLDATVEGKEIKAYFTAEHGLLDGNPQMSTDGGETYSSVSVAGKEEGRDYYNFKYGSKVKFQFTSNESYVVTGMKVDGVLYKADDKGCVSFDVKIDDFDFFFLDLKVEYEYLKPVGGEYELKIVNSAHITAKAYKEDKKTELAGSNQNDVVYLNVKSSSEDYSVREIKVTSPTSDIGGASETAVTKIDSEWYSFKTPYSYSKVVTITIVEANNTVLKNCDAVGSYMVVTIASSVSNIDSFDDLSMTLTADGALTMSNNRNELIVGYNGTSLMTDATSSYELPYGKNFIVGCFDGDRGIKSPFGGYNYIFIKKDNASDPVAEYKIYGEQFVSTDNHKYVAIEVEHNDKTHACAFFDLTTNSCFFGVTYNFIEGEHINDDMLVYEVLSNDGTKVCVIGSNGVGTNKSRCTLGDYYGTYTCDEYTLVIKGTIKAIYNGIEYNYSINESTITLKNSEKEIVLSLDNGKRTFSKISERDLSITLPPFAGKAFRNIYAFPGKESWEVEKGFYVCFSATELKLSCVCACNYNLDLDHCDTQLQMKNVDVEYEYDETTHIISCTLVCYQNAVKQVYMEYKDNCIYVSSQEIGNGKYANTTAKLTEIK